MGWPSKVVMKCIFAYMFFQWNGWCSLTRNSNRVTLLGSNLHGVDVRCCQNFE